MKYCTTPLKGCYIIEPSIFKDNRGYFMESYNLKILKKIIGYDIHFVQENQSYSTKNVLRGLHFQKGNSAQAKLIRVIDGCITDVAVDLRPQSKTFGKYFSLELSAENQKQLFIPRGFAHGFLVKSQTAICSYKCDNYYDKSSEEGIIYDDKELSIDWGISGDKPIISDKDQGLGSFSSIKL